MNNIRVNYADVNAFDLDIIIIIGTISRLGYLFNNPTKAQNVADLLRKKHNNENYYSDVQKKIKHSPTLSSSIKETKSEVSMIDGILYGGEKTIIKESREHLTSIHPTQKPPRLIERLLALVCKVEPNKPKPLVVDTFRGSVSTDIACMNFGCDCISFEIDDEYFDKGEDRKAEHKKNLQPDLFKECVV